jgi:hypothetical protein
MKSTEDNENLSEYDAADDDDADSSAEEFQTHDPQSFVQYNCHDDVVWRWTRGTVLSGVLVKGKLCICHRFGTRSLLLEFTTIEDSAKFSFGLWYFEIQYVVVEDEETRWLQNVTVDCYALLLPLLSIPAENQKYALVTSNWLTWDGSGGVVQPYTLSNS